jgi:protein-disulfide isomerase
MLGKHCLISIGAALGLCIFSISTLGQDRSTVIAEIGGHPVTADELQKKEESKLLQARYKYYVAERDALEQYIDDQLLEMQAKKESLTVEELLKRHASVNTPDPTEDQLRFYYEGVQTDEPYETARPNILDTIHQLRAKKAREAYVASLRAEYGVITELNPPSAQVEAGKSPRLGPETAPVQIIEYADYECPYCQKVSTDLSRLRKEFPDQVSLVYKDFPLPMHPLAVQAAEGARCAGTQGKFWEFHDFLFQTKQMQVADMKQEARALKLDGERFDQCLDKQEQFSDLKKEAQEGQHLGLTGTPSFFINGHFMSGAIGYAKLRETVERELGAMNANSTQSAAMMSPKPTDEQKK